MIIFNPGQLSVKYPVMYGSGGEHFEEAQPKTVEM